MSSRLINFLLLTIIIILVITLIVTYKYQRSTDVSRNEQFLINFDQRDFNRLKEMVNRFKEGKGDNLMIIPPIVDGGYWIHDVISNGREIQWVVDNSRDGMSSERGKVEYICKSIDINESEDYYTFVLSNCKNIKEDEILNIVSFIKEEL